MAERAEDNRSEGVHRTDRTAPAGAVVATRPTESKWLSIPWIAILFITATFHFYRGVPIDGWMFLILAVALTADLVRKARTPRTAVATSAGVPSRARVWMLGGMLVAVMVLVWAVLLLAPAASIGVPAVVGMVGIVMLLIAWPDPPSTVAREGGERTGTPPAAGQAPRMRRATYWWAGVVLFLCLWELSTYFIDRFAPTDEGTYPPLTDLLAPLFAEGSSRWLMTALWLAACAALLRQVRRP
jgi:hypothetical protein